MENYIERVDIIGLYGRYDIVQEFNPGINIIFGENGEFKTTLLHILMNFLDKDFRRFLYLDFNQIIILMGDGTTYFLKWSSSGKSKLVVSKNTERRNIAEISRREEDIVHTRVDLPKAAYFPTFRSVIEAWFTYEGQESTKSKSSKEDLKEEISDFLRKIFGNFIPTINFPSLPEVVSKISRRMTDASKEAILRDQKLTAEIVLEISNVVINMQNLSLVENQTIESNSSEPEALRELIKEIRQLLDQINEHPLSPYLVLPKTIQQKIESIPDQILKSLDKVNLLLPRLLSTYKTTLEKELFEINQIFSEFTNYIDSLNSFITRKKLEIFNCSSDTDIFQPSLRLRYLSPEEIDDEDIDFDEQPDSQDEQNQRRYDEDLSHLSSGERQIVSLLYASHISSQEIILIDEPEISLHTMWQEILLEELHNQIGEKQIIVCTHSPSIGADHVDEVQCMNISNTDDASWEYDSIVLNDVEDSETRPSEEKKTQEEPRSDEDYPDKSYYEEEYEDLINSGKIREKSVLENQENLYQENSQYEEENQVHDSGDEPE